MAQNIEAAATTAPQDMGTYQPIVSYSMYSYLSLIILMSVFVILSNDAMFITTCVILLILITPMLLYSSIQVYANRNKPLIKLIILELIYTLYLLFVIIMVTIGMDSKNIATMVLIPFSCYMYIMMHLFAGRLKYKSPNEYE